jgi:glycosyltransferase involved in cell wall biosynthesis
VGESPQAVCAPYLSLIIPAYNEGTRLGTTLRTVVGYLSAQAYTWELLVVDDGSDDDTLALARTFADEYPAAPISVIANPHRGKAYAVRTGVGAARGKLVGFTDADLATPIDTVGSAIEQFAAGADVVIGSREGIGAVRRDEPAYRHLMGRVFNGLVQIVALPGIQDTQTIFAATRLYDEQAAAPQGPAVTGFDVELLFLARRYHYRIAEVPVVWQYVAESKVNPLRDTLRNFRDLLMVRINSVRGYYR